MVKYPFELKLQIVKAYLSGEGGYVFLQEKYHIKNKRQVMNWVTSYKNNGVNGLRRKIHNNVYDSAFKLNAVKLYLTTEKSYRELSEHLDIDNASLLPNWVRAYHEKGELAFSNVRRKPRKKPDLPQPNSQKQGSTSTATEQKMSQLQQENLRLKIEVEYLKGLRRLRQEQHKRENLEWSATSIDPSSSQSKNF